MHFDTKLGFFVELHNFFQEAIGTENQIIRFLLGRKGLHLKQTMAVAVHNAQAIGNRAPFESMSQEWAQNNCFFIGFTCSECTLAWVDTRDIQWYFQILIVCASNINCCLMVNIVGLLYIFTNILNIYFKQDKVFCAPTV